MRKLWAASAAVAAFAVVMTGCHVGPGFIHPHMKSQEAQATVKARPLADGQGPVYGPPPRMAANQQAKAKAVTERQYVMNRHNTLQAHRVRGIYVSGWVAGGPAMKRIVDLLDHTDLNTVVIDIKTDAGLMTYRTNVMLPSQIGVSSKVGISDVRALLNKLKQKNVYVIGRLVVFKDPLLAAKVPSWAIHHKTGEVWHDKKGVSWVDPFRTEVWNYNIAIAKEAITLGFDEIQFDYVRFPDNATQLNREAKFANPEGWSKAEAIRGFLHEARTKLKPLGAYISADVFGLTTSSDDDMGIGQKWEQITREVDFISPMIYPSHYSMGMYGVEHPDLEPYQIVHKAMRDAKRRNLASAGERTAKIRPWYQNFTATWVHPHLKYGEREVMQQIQAAKEQGIDQFLLWSPVCKYTYSGK